MRRILDRFYAATLWLAALCLLAIAALVGVQVGARILDKLLILAGVAPTGLVILSLTEFAGYLLVAGSFLGLAATLKAGVHIRVSMFLGFLPEGFRKVVEMAILAFAAFTSSWAAWQISRLAYDSWRFNELSPGLVPMPLWWPQAAMAFGAAALVVSLLDELVITARSGRPSFRRTEDAIALGKEG
jgi:TRAP-type C4-dicarboxylate transport system permease small subunit